MLPHPGFEIPDAFLQTGVRRPELNVHRPEVNVHRPEVNVHRPEVNVRRPQLSNGCLQGGYHGWLSRMASLNRTCSETHPAPYPAMTP